MSDDDSDVLNFEAADDAVATVMTHGGTFRPLVDAMRTGLGVDDARFNFEADRLRTAMVDPANVGMCEVALPSDAFTAYDAPDDGHEVGVPLTGAGSLKKPLTYARKGRGSADGDPIRIDVFDTAEHERVRVQVLREDQGAKRTFEFYAIDTDSIRQEPDLPDISLPYRADPSPTAFRDAVHAVGDDHDHAWFTADGLTFVMGTQSTRNPTLMDADSPDDIDAVDAVEFPSRAWAIDDADGEVHGADGSMFSTDYLKPFASGLKDADANELTIRFGDEFPAWLEFKNTGTGLTGRYLIAPQIQPADGDI